MESARKPRFKVGDAVDFYDDAQHKWSKGTVTNVQNPKNKYSPFSYDLDCTRDVKEHLMEQWHSLQGVSTRASSAVSSQQSLQITSHPTLWTAPSQLPTYVEKPTSDNRIIMAEPIAAPPESVVRDLTVTERTLESNELTAPEVVICERVVEVPHIHEQDIVVEVPEVHHHKVTKHLPVYNEEVVDVPTEVAQIHHREEIQVKPEWQEEVVEKRVPVVTVREVENPVLKPTIKEEEEVVEVPVTFPRIERIIQRPIVEIRPTIHQVKGATEIKRHEPEYVEVPHVVQVPRVVPVPKTEHRVTTKEVVVPHIRRVEKIVEVPQEVVIEKTVEVPQVHVQKTVRYVPRFTQSDEVDSRDIAEEDPHVVAADALRQARSYIGQLEKQKQDLGIQLEVRLNQIRSAQTTLEEEMRVRIQLEAQLEQAQAKMGREFAAASPSTITSAGEYGVFSPGSSTISPTRSINTSPHPVNGQRDALQLSESRVVGVHGEYRLCNNNEVKLFPTEQQ